MLTHLTIRDLALVDRVELPFGPGLNVLTGETGAGKSVLVSALSIVLGARAQTDVVRDGAKVAVVEALFELEPGGRLAARLEAQGIEAPDGELLVRRSVARGARGRVHLNGQLATVSMLASVLDGIVELTGQHEHVSLLDPEQHAEFLDGFGGHEALRRDMAEAHAEVGRARGERSQLDQATHERARREDYLRFAIEELEAASLADGELEALEGERTRLRSVRELSEGAARAEDLIRLGDRAALDGLGQVEGILQRLRALDPGLEALASSALEVVAGLEDLAHGLGRYRATLEADPARLDEVEDRVSTLRRLCKKYGGTESAARSTLAEMQAELEQLENHDARRAALEAALEAAERRRAEVGEKLSAARKKAAKRLAKAVQTELGALSMGGTRVEVSLPALPEPGARGAEAVELLLSANPGEPLRPLRKSASGGELSRVLLAIKGVLARHQSVASHVFDEVDAGIGGAVAEVVGAKLKTVAAEGQVIAVTHLPQVAAYADHHVLVRKGVEGGRTLTRVECLDEADRVEELARMVGGLEITERTRGLAQELRDRGQADPATRAQSRAGRAAKGDRAAGPPRRPKRRSGGSQRRLRAAP